LPIGPLDSTKEVGINERRNTMSLIVTGASGHLGRLAAETLLDAVGGSELILLSRTPDALASFKRRGVRVRYGDFSKPESLAAAFDGGKRALIVSVMPPGDIVAQHETAFRAAERAGVQRIVYTSFPNPIPENPAPPAAYQRASEQALQRTGVEWTILRNALYADYRIQIAARYMQAGRWITNAGQGHHAYISRADCATAAAGAMTAEGHVGKTYEITGPELIDASRFTALLEEFSGRPIRCEQVEDDAFERYRTAFSADPANASFVELYAGTGAAMRGEYLAQLSACAQELIGRAPLSLQQLFSRDRA
jgi:NAD(P)H dehydrogenase (quinone)